MRSASLVLVFAFVAGCGDEAFSTEPGPLMRPGDNCLRCHSPFGEASRKAWSAAGTVFPSRGSKRTDGLAGVTVIIRDAKGKEVRLVTNEAGNFYTSEPLVDPLRPALEIAGRRIEMPVDAPAGSCNACHSLPPVGGASGRIIPPR